MSVESPLGEGTPSPVTFAAVPPAGQPIVPTTPFVDDDYLSAEEDEPTVLEGLLSELKREVKREDVLLKVPLRPNMTVSYSPNITGEQLKRWRKSAGSKRRDGEDNDLLSRIVLASTCTGIYLDGKQVTEDGEPMTFQSEKFLSMVGQTRVADAVKSLYQSDADIESQSIKVLIAAGYGQDPEEVDPLEMNTGSE